MKPNLTVPDYRDPPVEGILLTMRLGSDGAAETAIASVSALLDKIELDELCRYLVVLGIDEDEKETDAASRLVDQLQSRANLNQQMQSLHVITNSTRLPGEPFAICAVWDRMAAEAWRQGADWVVLLGDDIDIDCPNHYQAFCRSFLDISRRLGVPFGFGCPFWNDKSFPGFPSFPAVGRQHFEIFTSLIPKHRQANFVNQDLDPYLHHLYLKLGASPCVSEAILWNKVGGHVGTGSARYERVPAEGWQDIFLQDYKDFILPAVPRTTEEVMLLDVIVPSYRVRLYYLNSICSLRVPSNVHSNFIIIVDNRSALLRGAHEILTLEANPSMPEGIPIAQAETVLEAYLSQAGNNVRVRCNEENLGASASRNRGLDESAAEFVLNLDDDLIPDDDLLERYCGRLSEIDEEVVGLVGLVRFPRDANLPLKHAAVLMSYLTFVFEIAERNPYTAASPGPAWGVTANILFRRSSIRFDLAYAKTGGGEDVDFALRITQHHQGYLLAVPEARVVHPFWEGSVFSLFKHFYSWAIGDGALFKRFPEHCYWSFPNLPEVAIFLALPVSPLIGTWNYFLFVVYSLIADFVVDASSSNEYSHRKSVVDGIGRDKSTVSRSAIFYFFTHILANLYVVWLECGRLRGHIGRFDIAHGVSRRFDWHIGRLPNAPNDFRKKEACKFGLYVSILVAIFLK